MTIRDEAHCISSVHGLITCNQFQELSSKREEADTKIFLCTKFHLLLVLNQSLFQMLQSFQCIINTD